MTFPQIDPVAVSIGPLQIHWYGLMYLVGFVGGWWLLKRRTERAGSGWTREQLSDMLFYIAMGVILGGRLGYVLFYNFGKFLDNPLWLFEVWTGGMSFHGGAIGVLIAFALLARRFGKRYFSIADFVVPVVPMGLGVGRLGNFINGELWGRPSEMPWAMIFPSDRMGVPRHPSQLYEFLLEGVLLFAVLWLYSAKPRPAGAVTGLFGVGYGLSRICVEFFREPDAQLGYLAGGWLTMGMLLSIPMVVIGAAMIAWAYRHDTRRVSA